MSAPPPPAAGGPPESRIHLFAGLLVAQVLVLAFILAAFPARNPDLWTHLAVGRLIAAGDYKFGEDPLAYTTAGVYWVNHAWLSDLVTYKLYAALGDGLVVLKGLFVVGIAAVLLSCRRAGAGLVVPALLTALALFAMSPRLLLQPALVSVGLLAVTVRLLLRPPTPRAVYFLPLVMVLWVNLDEWFILGPLAVGLVWLGERLTSGRAGGVSPLIPAANQGADAPRSPGSRAVPTWLLAAVVAACCLSPHHVKAFVLPPELSPAARAAFGGDPRFDRVFEPGWRYARFADPAERLTAGGVAYLALLVLGLVSFVATRRSPRWDRLLLWLAFLGLSLWNVRLVAFFAAVAGPVTALNLQDWAAARPARPAGKSPRRSRLGPVGQLSAAVAGFAVLAVCWTGWPQAPLTDARNVGWAVQPDAGMRDGAEARAGWRADGRLGPDDRAFHVHPDGAAHAAYFAPGERCFLDHRLGLFGGAAKEYATVCKALGVSGEPDGPFPGAAAGPLRDRGVTVVVLTDPSPARLDVGFFRLYAARAPLLAVSGREATFGLPVGGRGGRPFGGWALDPATAGFAGGADRPPPPPAEPDPGARSVWGRVRAAWADPLRPPQPRPAGADAAEMYLRAFQAEAAAGQGGPEVVARVGLGSLAGALAGGRNPFVAAARAVWVVDPGLGLPSPSAALLAVRAARAAVAADPNDAAAQYRLGRAYYLLANDTPEHGWADAFRPLAQLRHVQAAFPLERAAALDPDLADARAVLAQAYADRRMLDAALVHLREQARATATRGAGPGGAADLLDRFEAEVRDRRNEFTLRAPGLAANPVGRARAALDRGLARAALDEVLLVTDVVQFGTEGAKLELELLLMLGRAARLRQELDGPELGAAADRLGVYELPGSRRPGLPRVYRLPALAWFRFLAAAADGDYEAAEAELDRMGRLLAGGVTARGRAGGFEVAGLTGIGFGLAAAPGAWPFRARLAGNAEQVALAVREENRTDTQVRADLLVLAGLMAAERGAVDRAADRFREALRLGASDEVGGAGFAAEPVARAYLNWIAAARAK